MVAYSCTPGTQEEEEAGRFLPHQGQPNLLVNAKPARATQRKLLQSKKQ